MKDAKNIMAIFEPEASIIDMGSIAFVKYVYNFTCLSGTFMIFDLKFWFTALQTVDLHTFSLASLVKKYH